MKVQAIIGGLILTFLLLIFGCQNTDSKVNATLRFQKRDSTLILTFKNSGKKKFYLPLDNNFILNSKAFFVDNDGFLTTMAVDLRLTLLVFYGTNSDYNFIEESGVTAFNDTSLIDSYEFENKALDSLYIIELSKKYIVGEPVFVYEKHFLSVSDTLYKSLSASDKTEQASVYQRHYELMKNKKRYYLSPGDELVNKICIKNWLGSVTRQISFKNYKQLAIVYDEEFSGKGYGFGLRFPARVSDFKLFPGRIRSDTLFIDLKY